MIDRPWLFGVVCRCGGRGEAPAIPYTVHFSGQGVLSLPCERARLRARDRCLKGVSAAHSHSIEQKQEVGTRPRGSAGLPSTHGAEAVPGGGKKSEFGDALGCGSAGQLGRRSRRLARRGNEERVRGRARSRVGGPAGYTRSRGLARRGKGRASLGTRQGGRGYSGGRGARRRRATIAPLSTARSTPADIALRPVIPMRLVRVVPYAGG